MPPPAHQTDTRVRSRLLDHRSCPVDDPLDLHDRPDPLAFRVGIQLPLVGHCHHRFSLCRVCHVPSLPEETPGNTLGRVPIEDLHLGVSLDIRHRVLPAPAPEAQFVVAEH